MIFLYKKTNPLIVQILLVLVSVILLLSTSISTKAEPYLALKNNLKCIACHINPSGGGLRNDFGKIYGYNILPARVSRFDSGKFLKLNPLITLGADARFNANFQENDKKNDNSSKSFDVTSAQVYLNIEVPNSGLSFYLDQQVAPGSAINREAYVQYLFEQNSFVKAGKLFLAYGLRIEDDSAFIRQATGMNFDNSDNGIEYSLNYDSTTVNFYVANGTSQTSNDDDRFLYGARVEHLFDDFRLGVSAVLNDSEQQTQMFNLYGGKQWRDVTFLAEVDYITLEATNNLSYQYIKQLVGLVEINYQWQAGWNFKLTAEYFDPDKNVGENEQARYSFVAEYTPLSNIQLRFGMRVNDDIPQKPDKNYQQLFIQSHFYF
jgi:hypothetical protein